MREGTRGTALRRAAPLAAAALWTLLGALVVVELFGARGRPPLLEACALVLALACAAALSRSRPLTALGVMLTAAVLQLTASGALLVETSSVAVWLAVMPLAFLAGLRSERVRPVVLMAAIGCGFALAVFVALGVVWGYDTRSFLSRSLDWLGGALTITLCTLTPWLLGRYLLFQGRVSSDGWAIAERMERARAADADRARLRERARIATRMHDSLGHDLALIAVRAAALEMSAPDGSEQRRDAGELRSAAHEANLRLREVIGVLREGDGDPAEPVADLVRRAADAGLSVRLVREGADPDPATPGGRAVHRVVREALTNAAKYAPGARVTVRVVREGSLTRVSVRDTGARGAAALPARRGREGSGLLGLRDLVHRLGGVLDAGPADAAEPGAPGTGTGEGRGLAGTAVDASAAGRGERAASEAVPGRGFAVRATVPDTPAVGGPADDDATLPGASGPSEARRAHAEVRERARRRLAAAVAVPAALAAGALAGDLRQPDLPQDLVHAGARDPAAHGLRGQVGAGAAPRVRGVGGQQRADLARRARQPRVLPAVDQGLPGRGPGEAEQQPHRRRLARAIGTEKSGHPAGFGGEGQSVHRVRASVALGQVSHREHVVPLSSVRVLRTHARNRGPHTASVVRRAPTTHLCLPARPSRPGPRSARPLPGALATPHTRTPATPASRGGGDPVVRPECTAGPPREGRRPVVVPRHPSPWRRACARPTAATPKCCGTTT